MKGDLELNRLLKKAEAIHNQEGPLAQRKRIIQSLNVPLFFNSGKQETKISIRLKTVGRRRH